jgi:alpha-tubulin suppressor-like RCC1 family protein
MSTGPDACQDPCSTIPVSAGISATSLASDGGTWCAILTSGSVDCWGGNDGGDLGIGTTGGPDECVNQDGSKYPCSTRPVPIGISATSLVGSWTGNFCAILTSGGVDCWGLNEWGQVGNGTTGSQICDGEPCTTAPSPVGISATSLASDNGSYCALLTSGTIDCWGSNAEGDLGIGTIGGPQSCPGVSVKPEPCSMRPVSTGISAMSLAGEPGNYCAILSAGAVDCWGSNVYGELGDGSSNGPQICEGDPCSTAPGSVGISATSVVGNGATSCAILTSGAVDCWGSNANGAVGDGTTGGPDACYRATLPCNTTPVSTGISATRLITDGSGFCAILTSSSSLDCWGANDYGQVGNGLRTGPETCLGRVCSTTPMSTGVTAISVDSDGFGYCAILTSGAADCWGNNYDGELGDNSTANSYSPVPVLGIGP